MKQMLPNPIHSSSPLCFNQAWLDCVFSEAETVWIGFSGGVDSHVLLHAIVEQLSSSQRKKLAAVHVHHGLSDNADDWLVHCENVCQQLEVRFVAQRVQLETQASLEDAARNARYQVFESVMSANDVLLLAHHAGDQVETVLFRLLRGTGGKGLAGIPNQRQIGDKGAYVLRPFLNVSKKNIEEYAEEQQLEWIQDESNVDERFTRNFLRQTVLPLLKKRFPKLERNIVSNAKRIEMDYIMLSQFTRRQMEDWCNKDGGLDLALISEKSLEERLFWLRHFLLWNEVGLSHAQLENVEFMMFGAVDKHPEFVLSNGHRLLRHQNSLYLLPPDQVAKLGPLVAGEVLKCPFYEISVTGSDCCVLRERPQGALLQFKNGKSRKLKKWLNDIQVPSWWREHLPYIFIGNELIAIGTLWRHPNYLYIDIEWHLTGELPLLVGQSQD